MSWVYEQQSGRIIHGGELVGDGYSGVGDGLNDPGQQDVAFMGPAPRGTYTIGAPISDGGHMGPFVLPLTPWPSNNMFGRLVFFIHGDKIDGPPNSASEGCIITARVTRSLIAQSGDTVLIVT